jgi:ABC-type multidrug transport system ATPase subunit
VAEDIVHRYGDRLALDSFSITVPQGCVFGILGPNGSGKSTFMTLLAAMETPREGTLRVFGQPPSRARRAEMGVVFQENTQDPLLSVNETLQLAGRLFGMSHGLVRQRSEELLAAFGLGDRGKDAVSTLSGGMRRRLEMARALLHDPRLLLLDEPTTGVDPEERRALWDALLGPERGQRTILLATNDLAEADAVCDEVAFLQDGRAVASGTPKELKRGLRRDALQLRWDNPTTEQLDEIGKWPGTGEISLLGEMVHITVDDAGTFVPRLFALAPGAIHSVTIERSSLEDAYFQHVSRPRKRTPEAVA